MPTELAELKRAIDEALKRPRAQAGYRSKLLDESIDYALSSGGKRLRPLLVLSYAESLSPKSFKKALPAALAVEYVHTYSLVHDDLPAMDNDDYRRGRLSTHRRFDEATAILSGDALLADAFFLLTHAPLNALEQCRELAKASGRRGLVSGQMEDLLSVGQPSNQEQWTLINRAKTGSLFEACAVLGALSVDADKQHIEHARSFGQLFGETFQLQDDLDDNQGLACLMEKKDIKNWFLKNIEQLNSLANFAYNKNIMKTLILHTFKTTESVVTVKPLSAQHHENFEK